jgi:glycosyltransferase involved in cell wall biosynthesis
MKVAIVANSGEMDGGSHTYEKNILHLINEVKKRSDIQFEIYYTRVNYKIKIEDFFSFLRSTIFGFAILKFLRLNLSRFEKELIKKNIDLVYFVSPNAKVLGIKMLPIITTVWDMGHRDLPQFIETGLGGNFELREYFLEKTAIKSFRIICDSESTRSRISRIYGVDDSRILKLGLPLIIEKEILENKLIFANNTGEKYFIYPANFWKHKNHIMLLDAFKIFLNYHDDTKLILIGSDKGNLESVQDHVKELEIKNFVEIFGYVNEIDKYKYLYNSIAILVPTLLGPTNYPIYEGILLGKKVIASSIHAQSSTQDFNADVCFVNPLDPDEWAREMLKARSTILNSGLKISLMEQEIENNVDLLLELFNSAKRNLLSK